MNTVVAGAEAPALPIYEAKRLELQAEAECKNEDWEKASMLFQKSIDLRRQCVSSNDPNVALLLDKLAITLMKRHLPDSAELALADAEKLLESRYYPSHGLLAPILEHHADCLIEMGLISLAEDYLKRAQEIYAKTVTLENRDTLKAMLKLSRLYVAEGKPVEAEALIEKAMKHVDTPLGPIAEFRYQLALVYLEEGKTDEARRLLELSLSQFQQRHNYARVADCLEKHAAIAAEPGGNDQLLKEEMEKYRRLNAICPYPQDIFFATLFRP